MSAAAVLLKKPTLILQRIDVVLFHHGGVHHMSKMQVVMHVFRLSPAREHHMLHLIFIAQIFPCCIFKVSGDAWGPDGTCDGLSM